MLNEINESNYVVSNLALAYSRMGEVFGKNNLDGKAQEYHRKAILLMSDVIDYKIKYGSFLFNNNKINDAEKQYLKHYHLTLQLRRFMLV